MRLNGKSICTTQVCDGTPHSEKQYIPCSSAAAAFISLLFNSAIIMTDASPIAPAPKLVYTRTYL